MAPYCDKRAPLSEDETYALANDSGTFEGKPIAWMMRKARQAPRHCDYHVQARVAVEAVQVTNLPKGQTALFGREV